jgi:hypothetical protein
LEVDADKDQASMISERSRDVYNVVACWDRVHVGKTSRSEGRRLLRDSDLLAEHMNCALYALLVRYKRRTIGRTEVERVAAALLLDADRDLYVGALIEAYARNRAAEWGQA